MSNFRLKPREGSETFHRISYRRKDIGRVCQHEDGRWMCVIGKEPIVYASNRDGAFAEGVARHLGFADAAAMHKTNREASADFARRAVTAAQGVSEYLTANTMDGRFRGLDKALGLSRDGVVDSRQMDVGFKVMTRALFGKPRRAR